MASVVAELTDLEGDWLRTNLVGGMASSEGFSDWLKSFQIKGAFGGPGEGGILPPNHQELLGAFGIGHSYRNKLFVYAEVQDELVRISDSKVSLEDVWQYGSFEFGWGNYDVCDVP